MRKLQFFAIRRMSSGDAFHRAYPHATQQARLEAHEHAFDYFGGVFKILRYDNMTSVVKKILTWIPACRDGTDHSVRVPVALFGLDGRRRGFASGDQRFSRGDAFAAYVRSGTTTPTCRGFGRRTASVRTPQPVMDNFDLLLANTTGAIH